MAWAKNGTPHTLSSTGDTLEITDLTAKKFHIALCHVLQSGSLNAQLQLDSDTGTKYSRRVSANGGADATVTSDTKMFNSTTGSTDRFYLNYICNIDGEEVLGMTWEVDVKTAGATTAPERQESVGKFSDTTQVTAVSFDNAGAGDYATGSNLSALASDLTPASATSIETGSIYIDTDTADKYLFNGTDWKYMNAIYGIIAGGTTGSQSNVMDYITIATLGNATDFGDLTVSREATAGASNTTRGVIAGGFTGSPLNVMDYVTIRTPSNATDFGDLLEANYALGGNTSTETRGVFGGGFDNSINISRLQYITIATTGNATNMGNLNQTRRVLKGVCSETRGVYGGGYTTSQVDSMDYFTIETNANASDFGNLTVARWSTAGVMSFTRGIFGGGYSLASSPPTLNVIDYITIATLGNATDFGDLTTAKHSTAGVTDRQRGCWSGDGSYTNVIEYVTIDTLGNATDFGDLTVGRSGPTGVQGG